MRLHAAVVFVLAGLLMSAPAGEAKNRPTVDDPSGADCWNDPGADGECSALLCTCCYDDGCWICSTDVSQDPNEPAIPQNCEWDPKARVFSPTDTLTISPGQGRKPKLPPMLPPLQTPQMGPAK